ncbi:MAG: hypothetical protein H6719_20205 [Sandaracinaceae bacterium]|nr:hypothetical protein [Sandaracinaceae bacterium]
MSRAATERVSALAVIALATGLLFAPAFAGLATGAPRWFEWDVPEQYWPDLVYTCAALHDGELPLWNPYDRAGYPSYADPQAATYHPLTWAICAFGPSPGLGWATARVILGFFLAGAFGWLWLRRLQVPPSGALLGAVVIEAAPFMRHNWELNLTSALAYLPLMLWAADRAMVERRAQDGLVLGGAVALCAWTGSPPALWLASSLTLLYATFRLTLAVREAPSALWPGLGVGLLGAAVASGLAAAVLVPGLTLAEHSVQAGRSYASIAEGGLEPRALGALLWAQPGNHLYFGLLTVIIGVRALRSGRPLALFFFAILVVAVGLALGDHGPLFPAAFEAVPGVRLFRLPHRYEAWIGPAAGALAALGLAEIERARPGRRERRWLRIVAFVVAAVGAPLAFLAPPIGLVALGTAALFYALAQRRVASVALGATLALLVLADVTRTLPPDRHMRGGPPPGDEAGPILALAPGTDAAERYMDEFGIGCRSGTRLGRRDLRGYQDPLELHAYERVVDALRETPALAEQYNVRYALQGPHFIHGWDRHYLPPPRELRERPGAIDRGRGVTELTRALPFAYWVAAEQVERAADRPAALARVRALAPAPIAILDGAAWPEGAELPPAGVAVADAARVAATRVELARDTLGFHVEAPSAGLVVVNEAFYPGWTATVDGRPVPIFRANALVRAVPVEAGPHEVAMVFAPPDGAPLRWLLLATLALSGLAWGLLERRRRARG